MADNPRIEELRRRVLADPASIAFAALAEEYRRSGNYAEAIETCRTGLQRHPSYVSARVTLGRALIETAQYDEARQELELVLKSAPENLAAIRGLAEIHERQRSMPDADFMHAVETAAQTSEPSAPSPAADAAPAAVAAPVAAAAAAAAAESAPADISIPRAVPEAPVLPAAADAAPVPASLPIVVATPEPVVAPDLIVARLEQFLVAIQSARTSAHVSR